MVRQVSDSNRFRLISSESSLQVEPAKSPQPESNRHLRITKPALFLLSFAGESDLHLLYRTDLQLTELLCGGWVLRNERKDLPPTWYALFVL